MAPEKEQNEEAEEYPSASLGQEHMDNLGDEDSEATEALMHPVPSMQSAFEESILESTEESDLLNSSVEPDAQSRRHQLLECKQYDDSWVTRWKQSPTAQHHPLLKLMAQIVFGMHLLQQRQAKSEKEVVKILQTHVNEVDTFLENTAEDFNISIKDIDDRIRYLKLPMAHMDVFETMLDDKKFRTQLLEGNERIERIIERTTTAMNASLLDIERGAQANKELSRYMKTVQNSWPHEQRTIWDVFVAMRGNEQGWRRYLRDLQSKATILARILAQLHRLIGDMSRMAAAASRRNKTQSSTVTPEPKSAPSTPKPRSKFSQDQQPPMPAQLPPRSSSSRTYLNKPLPKEPRAVLGASQDSTPMPHPVPFADRYESPRQSPPDPSAPPRTSAVSGGVRQRPKTAGEALAADARVNASELLDFFQRPDPLRSNPNPLRSNPPGESLILQDNINTPQKLGRSHSHGTNLMMSTVAVKEDGAKVTRSRSQGAIDILTIPPTTNVEKSSNPQNTSMDKAMPLPSEQNRTEPVRLSSEQTEKRAAMRGTGFARRLSKRLKHLPVNLEAPVAPKKPATVAEEPVKSPATPITAFEKPVTVPKGPQPPDSAYSSLRDKDSPPNEPTTNTATRPESFLGPLPFEKQRPPQLEYSRPSQPEYSRPFGSSGNGVAASVRSLTSAKSRSLRVRNLFRSKWRREKVLPA